MAKFIVLGMILVNENDMSERRADLIQEMSAMILSKISSFPIDCPIDMKIKIFRTIIATSFFFFKETWSFPLRKENRLRVFENGILKKIFGS